MPMKKRKRRIKGLLINFSRWMFNRLRKIKASTIIEVNTEEVMDKDEVMPADKDKVPTTTPTILTITTTMRDEKALQEDMVEDVQS